jgi:hypothetical protein
MRLGRWLACTLLLVLLGCSSDPAGTDVHSASDLWLEDTPVSCPGVACTTASDCAKSGPCIAATNCLDGCCSYLYKPEATACELPCEGGGACNATGECVGTEPLACVDVDGNPCTAAWCDPGTGTCSAAEKPVADGTVPMESNCWEGLVCKDGAVDESSASPSSLQADCAAQNEAVKPMGCVEQVVCVDSEPDCVVLHKDEGSQCWAGGGGTGASCPGHSCSSNGDCLPDDALTVECGEEAWPAECDATCQECTTLTCHWIDDPANPDSPKKKVKYCKPEAVVGETCDDSNDCTEGDTCALASQTQGPQGKETLGECLEGEGTTKEACLAEMEWPALSCLKAGTSCDPLDGCTFDQEGADTWCSPPLSVCYNKAQTYCTHQDALGDGKWNSETGCHIVFFAAEGCDDGNPCTEDLCDTGSGCINSQKENGTPCGEEMICQGGECLPVCVPNCDGKSCGGDGCDGSCGLCDDTNPCTLNICADGGQCTHPAGNQGAQCGAQELCLGQCQAGSCVETAVEVCNGQDDDCDDQVDEGDLCPAGFSCDAGVCKQDCTPAAGSWTDWSCGACSVECGGGTQLCTRSCTNPPPSCGGAQCGGAASEFLNCNLQICSNDLPTGTTVKSVCSVVTAGEVPAGKTSILLKAWGGGGGGGAPGGGGGGAFVQGTLAVQPGDELELRVGCGGEAKNGGGGASYVLKNGSTVLVAAGGGGGGSDGCSGCHKTTHPDVGHGGAGGPVNSSGQAGVPDNTYNAFISGGQGGSQGAGGAGGTTDDQSIYDGCVLNGYQGSANTGGANTMGICAEGYSASWYEGGKKGGGNGSGGGGGAGYFGGGGGGAKYTYNGGGGGGGSSWVAADVTGITSEGGNLRTPGGTGIPGYANDAGLGGQGQTDPFAQPLNATPGNPGLIIMVL